ncbi:uncharacterized protein LOC114145105 [Xiphophorus couchianus]|uniref:uncharacterized protein LOC114145105 n=1 Tax=Xiphophorus couchianus TaxID=32473 RepID=UPI00101642C5|nr:uncharacterized protein LOC114145105 [Xiphophorus couchianus]
MASPSPRCTPRKLRRIMSSKPAGPADRQERGCPTGTDKRWEGVAMAAAEPFESHGRGALLNLVRGGSEEAFFTVLDADGSEMSGAPMAERLHLNRTIGFEPQDGEADAPMFEVRVFNIVIIGLVLFVLAVAGLYCVSICYSRSRQSKRALIYESAVTRGEPENPVAVKAVKRSTSFINPLAFFRRPEAAKDNSRVYFIYSNPLPVGLNEEEEEEHKKATATSTTSGGGRLQQQTLLTMPPSLREYASDPSSGFILDPPIFYMQL